MRPNPTAIAIALCVYTNALVHAQIPQNPPLTPQERSDQFAIEKAKELELRLHSGLGSLDDDANKAIQRWDAAVVSWKRERGAGAAPYLAEGVLFDCLSRMHDVVTVQIRGEQRGPYFADMAAKRPHLAAEAFDAALKIDPSLIEARLRVARIRAPRNSAAVVDLERIAADPTAYPFSYLAAISRAEIAGAAGDVVHTTEWYQRALLLNPRSVAAPIALSLLVPNTAMPLQSVDTTDPYYSYPCKVMTPAIDSALATRIKLVVLK